MTTTTIRLPEELKERVARAAQHAGTTSHAFILHAIAESVEEAERRAEFNAAAEQRYARIIASGQTIPWHEMRNYLEEAEASQQAFLSLMGVFRAIEVSPGLAPRTSPWWR